ncbi:MAG TPA: ABC-type transport auxiliary lipoprotein family protein [Roseiarcus sp.]|nr:ABC-type transport auxiliary lipoprotein family protein [Roseiarcus sp.]
MTRAAILALVVIAPLAGCSTSTPQTYDLSAAIAAPQRATSAQLAVREPIASLDLDSQRILVRTGPETIAYLSGAQWSDRLPALVQNRLVQTFQNAKMLRSVSVANAGFAADYSLQLDIRAFELDVSHSQAVVDIAAKIIAERDGGRVVAARIFKNSAPAGGDSGPDAAVALNAALSPVMKEIVAFAAGAI